MNKTEIKWVYHTTGDLPEAPDDIFEKMWLRENNWGTPGTLENTNFIGGIMRHLLRRTTLFPIIACGSPLIYIMGWLMGGHRVAVSDVRSLLGEIWDGNE